MIKISLLKLRKLRKYISKIPLNKTEVRLGSKASPGLQAGESKG